MTSSGAESQFFTHVLKVIATAGRLSQNASAGSGLVNEERFFQMTCSSCS